MERLLTLDPAGFKGAIVGIAAAGAVIACRRATRLDILEALVQLLRPAT